MSSIYCRQGHQNSSDNRFCRLCGEPLTASASRSAVESHPDGNHTLPLQGVMVGDRYRLRQQLGHGGFGKTYLAEDINRFNEACVLKEFAPQVDDPATLKKAEQLFEREAGVLYQLHHPQIPRFRELLRVEFEGRMRLFLVQDYVRGHNYQELLDQRQQRGQTFSEADVLQLFQNVLPVLGYIHQKGVIHRDISPDNLMRRDDDQLPVLIDFGGVKQAAISVISGVGQASPPPAQSKVTIVGKQGYAPYEQMAAGDVEPHNDFYALAVTALVLLTGQSPQYLLDINSPGHWQTSLSLSPLLTRVLRKMLSVYPSDRYTTAQAILSTLFPAVPPDPHNGSPNAGRPNAGSNGQTNRWPGSTPAPPSPSVAASAPKATLDPKATINSTPTLAVAPGFPASVAVPVSSPPALPSSAPGPIYPASVASPSMPTAPATKVPAATGSATTAPAITTSPRRRVPSILMVCLLVLGIGTASAWAGSNLPRWVMEWTQQRDDRSIGDNGGNGNGDELEPSSQFSATEQRRKADLRAKRDRLQVSDKFLVQLTDASFYDQYPRQKGRALTANPDDAEWREKWDAIAAQWLARLETLLDAQSRSKLGQYGKSSRDQWKTIANGMNVSSRALYRLTDVDFFTAFPNQQEQAFLNQPIGQIWHGMADFHLRQFQSGKTLEKIQFAPGTYSTQLEQTLEPGQGHAFLINAKKGQILRLNLNAPRTKLSLYLPKPTQDIPFLLEDSLDQSWSGQLPQSGYYEIVVILDHPTLNDRASSEATTVQLQVSVDNVATPVIPDVSQDE